MFCKNCGNQIGDDSKLCAKCGTMIETETHPDSLGEKIVTSSKIRANDELLRALIGKSSDYYIQQFDKIERGEKSFNWCAFLFGSILTLYRKQYSFFMKVFLPVFILPFIAPLINAILYQFARPVSSFGYITAINVITYMYSLAVLIIGGVSFNKSYRKNLLDTIDRNRLLSLDSNELSNNNIVKKIQPSPIAAIVILLVYTVSLLVVYMIAPSTEELAQATSISFSDGTSISLDEYETGTGLSNTEKKTDDINSVGANEAEYIAVTAQDLSNAYSDNRISANQSYKDKLLEVSGVIYDFGSDDSIGVLYLVLKTNKNNDLLCIFSKDDSDVLASLKKIPSLLFVENVRGKAL